MRVIVDVNLLRQILAFDYLEIFELDSIEAPASFTEHAVPRGVELPKDDRSKIISRLANMRFARALDKTVVLIPRDELPSNWDFNILAVCIRGKEIPFVLFFYLR